MGSSGAAALASWNLNPPAISLLLLSAIVYWRGWRRGRTLMRHANDQQKLLFYLAGLGAIFLATESPLDSFDNLYLSAHMAQHLLLMMIAPPLILLGEPMLPILRGLPRSFVKDGLGPFLTWRPLRAFFAWLVSPVVAWVAFAFSTVLWHVPFFYELALASPSWHNVQHACFFWTGILFWWPIIRPGPAKYRWPLWVGIPYLLTADFVNTAISAYFIFSGKVLYPAYAAVQMTGLSARQDQTLAGAIMWVPGSVVYLLPAVFIAMQLLSPTRPRVRGQILRRKSAAAGPSRWKRWNIPQWRRVAQFAMLLLAVVVVADGFTGQQVSALNAAGVLPFIHWRGLSIIALLFVGNLFCMVCPFTLVRDGARRFLPAHLRWPRPLRNKWLPVALLIIYFWAYEAFSLWDHPWAAAAIIVGYFAGAVLVDGFFRGASFCKYVCPIGQFHFVTSLVSPREVTVRKESVCRSCRTFDCIRGNQMSRGCELDLFQPKKTSSLDCTFCLDCVKACPHDNVTLVQVMPAGTLLQDPYRSSLGRLSSRTDLAVLALVIVFGAFVNAAGMVSPVLMWEHAWHARLGTHSMPWIVAAFTFIGLLLVPGLAVGICALWNRQQKISASGIRRLVFGLVPLGAGMWAAHLLFHFITGIGAAWPVAKQFFQHSAADPVPAFLPSWLTPLQLLLLDAGLLLAFYVVWKLGKQIATGQRSSMIASLPWMALCSTLYVAGVWILFQPMQMRGMVH